MSENVNLSYNGKSWDYPIVTGTENEKAFDISKLRDQTGLVTLDNGWTLEE